MSNNKSNNNITKQFKDILRKINVAVNDASADIILDLADESLEVCPKDTGNLRKSMEVTKDGQIIGRGNDKGSVKRNTPRKKVTLNKDINLAITYNCDYAIYPHEMDDQSTHWTTPGTHSKYLENPAYHFDAASKMEKAIMKRLNGGS